MKTFLIIALTLLTATLANAQPPLSADERAVEDALVRAGIGSREAIHAANGLEPLHRKRGGSFLHSA